MRNGYSEGVTFISLQREGTIMGPIKRYVVYWTEIITNLVAWVIIIVLTAGLLYWVERTDQGAMTAFGCCILFISVACIMSIMERYGFIEPLNDVGFIFEEE